MRKILSLLLLFMVLESTYAVEYLWKFDKLPVTRANLKASQPFCSITSRGSIPLPKDLLIFLPCESLTRP